MHIGTGGKRMAFMWSIKSQFIIKFWQTHTHLQTLQSVQVCYTLYKAKNSDDPGSATIGFLMQSIAGLNGLVGGDGSLVEELQWG